MKQFEFNYNKKFNCIADNCKHNCCIGWQIDVDKKSLAGYKELAKTDARFNQNCFDGKSFNLLKGRCPFLDSDNLCHIIKNYGEKALCKTCKTHPRFKNFFSDRVETGLGLYCEEAGRIILSLKPKMKLVLTRDDLKNTFSSPFERKVFAFRNKALSIAQNRKLETSQKLGLLSKLSNIDLNKHSFNDWLKIYKQLDRLKINEFSFDMVGLAQNFSTIQQGFEREFEQLLSYLCFRHLSRAIDLLDLRVRLSFIVLSFNMINHLFSCQKEKTLDTLVEVCRFYASEIETSDDNIFSLLNEIESLISFI